MIKFIGEYKARIDDKGRLIFPSSFKALVSGKDNGPVRLVVRKDVFVDCLEMYTYEQWEIQSEKIKAMLNPFNRRHDAFWRGYTRHRTIVEPDPKLGRITIPKNLFDAIGATKDVIFCGSDDKIEIWAAEKYESSEIAPEDFARLAEEIASQN